MSYKLTVVTDGSLVAGRGHLTLDEATHIRESIRDENLTGDNILMIDGDMQTIIRHRNGRLEYDTNITIEEE